MTMTETGDAIVNLYCRELKLPGLRSAYQAIARDAANQGQSHTAFLAACLAQEIESRRQHRLATRLASLWTRSYFASTAGNVSSDIIQRYIEAQRGL